MKDGATVSDAAETLGIGRSTVGRWWKRYQEEGERGLKSRYGNSGRKKKTSAEQDEAMMDVSMHKMFDFVVYFVTDYETASVS